MADFVNGTDFTNDVPQSGVTILIDEASYNFPSNMQIKFRCDASTNNDNIYIDEVVISAQ